MQTHTMVEIDMQQMYEQQHAYADTFFLRYSF